MEQALHFSRSKQTIHLIKRGEDLRVVVKSVLFNPSTLIFIICDKELSLIGLAKRSLRLKGIASELQHSTTINYLFIDKEKREMVLEFDEKTETLCFSEEEWYQVIAFFE